MARAGVSMYMHIYVSSTKVSDEVSAPYELNKMWIKVLSEMTPFQLVSLFRDG